MAPRGRGELRGERVGGRSDLGGLFSMAVVTGGGAAGSGGEQVLTAPGGPGRLPPGLLENESLPMGLQKPGRKRAGGHLLYPSLLPVSPFTLLPRSTFKSF